MTDMPDLSAGRDEELGALLRAHLAAPDDAQFAARMRMAAVMISGCAPGAADCQAS